MQFSLPADSAEVDRLVELSVVAGLRKTVIILYARLPTIVRL